jgi:hypothetical protein
MLESFITCFWAVEGALGTAAVETVLLSAN